MAQTIVAGSNWIKGDLVNHFGLSPEKVQVIPWASPTEIYPKPASWEVGSVVTKYQLPDRFALYPAMTWEHKNHIRLLKALANLRDEAGIVVNLICTGKRREGFWHQIQDCIDDLKLHGQVRFLGMIPAEELRAIYSLSQFVVVPTLFEAASGPLFEAWQEGVPVACSNVTSLPEQAREAALLFDPFSVDAISTAVRKLASDDRLRAELIRKGGERIQGFSWERTAKAYRALYRKSARQELTDEDRRILERDWMRDPESAAQVAA